MIKLSGNDVTFGENTVSQSGGRLLTKSGIRGSVLTGKRTTGFHWNGHRFPPPIADSVLYFPGYPAQGSTIQDFSGNGNDGTITGAVWRRLPSGVWYLDLDAVDDDIVVSNDATIEMGTGDFTAWFWLNTSDTDTRYFLTKNTNPTAYWAFRLNAVANKATFEMKVTATKIAESPAVTNNSVWHLLLVTLARSGNMILYQDNVAGTAVDISGQSGNIDTDSDLVIGALTAASTPIAGGYALEGISKSVLTAAQRLDIYNQRHLFGV